MDDLAKILWVHEERDGPFSGMAEYNQRKVWFLRKCEEKRMYSLLELDSETLEVLQNNHIERCKKMGTPLLHGEPMTIFRKQQGEAKTKPLLSVKVHYHPMMDSEITGKEICSIHESAFANFFVEKILETKPK